LRGREIGKWKLRWRGREIGKLERDRNTDREREIERERDRNMDREREIGEGYG
jgi:hypothetical protein